MSILGEIYAYKRHEITRKLTGHSLEQMRESAFAAPFPRDFVQELIRRAVPGYPALIAEVKRQSPSRGLLVVDFDPLCIARDYIANGAAAISVLTDEHFFGGNIETLHQISALADCPPLLRKDFIFHPYQLYEARLAGADAVLLIAAMLPDSELAELYDLACELGLAVLVEVHTAPELMAALKLNPTLLGINNRNLDTFEVHLETSLSLRSLVPAGIRLVAESGIHHAQDVQHLADAGIDAILVGEALVTSPDLPAKVREISGYQVHKKVLG